MNFPQITQVFTRAAFAGCTVSTLPGDKLYAKSTQSSFLSGVDAFRGRSRPKSYASTSEPSNFMSVCLR